MIYQNNATNLKLSFGNYSKNPIYSKEPNLISRSN